MMNRRSFLKCGLAAGALSLSSFGSLGSLTACNAGAAPAGANYGASPQALVAKRWGMVIDARSLNESVDFERIASACHKNHNVPFIDDPKIEVKWIWQDSFEHCFAEMSTPHLSSRHKELMFPVLCNHCQSPMCVRLCPTKATFQRDDGIVEMDYHRCIGCRFCMTGCPYGARSLNFFDPRHFLDEISPNYPTRTEGVVEKCNFCAERLNAGQLPYCVEASEGTILFGDLEDPHSEVRQALENHWSICRQPELGTGPSVYYLLSEGDAHA